MVSITLFGKNWKFETDTLKYFGVGLAILYILRIVRYVVQKYLGGNKSAPPISDTQADQKTTEIGKTNF